MLTITSPRQINNIFERIIIDKNGVLVRVRFTVVNGKGQIVSVEPLKKSIACLDCVKSNTSVDFSEKNIVFYNIVSPYFSIDFLLNIQPTRAPASV